MLAAVRSTSCHAGGKPTGYVSLMDKKEEKGEKKGRTGSESAGCVDQRNRKNSGNADFAHSRELQRCELSQKPESNWTKGLSLIRCSRNSQKKREKNALKPVKKTGFRSPPRTRPEARAPGKKPRAIKKRLKKTSHVCISCGKPGHRRDYSRTEKADTYSYIVF